MDALSGSEGTLSAISSLTPENFCVFVNSANSSEEYVPSKRQKISGLGEKRDAGRQNEDGSTKQTPCSIDCLDGEALRLSMSEDVYEPRPFLISHDQYENVEKVRIGSHLSDMILSLLNAVKASPIVSSALSFFEICGRLNLENAAIEKQFVQKDQLRKIHEKYMKNERELFLEEYINYCGPFKSARHALSSLAALYLRHGGHPSTPDSRNKERIPCMLSEVDILSLLWTMESFESTKRSSPTLVLGQYTRHIVAFDESLALRMRSSWRKSFQLLRATAVESQRHLLHHYDWKISLSEAEIFEAEKILFMGKNLESSLVGQADKVCTGIEEYATSFIQSL